MKNYIQSGKAALVTALTDIASGDPVVVGSRVGVAAGDIAAGSSGAVAMEGVFSLPKATGAVDQGDVLYFDLDATPVGGASNAGAFVTESSGNTEAGWAFAAALSADTHVKVKLRG